MRTHDRHVHLCPLKVIPLQVEVLQMTHVVLNYAELQVIHVETGGWRSGALTLADQANLVWRQHVDRDEDVSEAGGSPQLALVTQEGQISLVGKGDAGVV